MSTLSRRIGSALALSVGLLSGLNCGLTSAGESGGDGDGDENGDGDGDDPPGGGTGGGGAGSGAAGSGATGSGAAGSGGFGNGTGGIQNSPVTDECWFDDSAGCAMGGAGATCPVSADIEVTCSVHRFEYLPAVMPSGDGAGLQFVAEMQFSSGMVDRHGQLQGDGSVTLTDLRDGPATNLSRYLPIGFDPDALTVDLLEERDDLISVSQPYSPSAGAATWVPALAQASSLRAYSRAPDGTLHILASRTDFTEGHAYGTAAGGMTDTSAAFTEFPVALGFTHRSDPVGYSPQDDDLTALVAQLPGQPATVVTRFDDNIAAVAAVSGAVESSEGPEYLVLASGGEILRLAADPASGLSPVDLPLIWKDTGDCPAEGCNGTCDFEGDFVRDESAARTSDGRVWVAAYVVHENTSTAYWVVTDEDAYICDSGYDRDESTSEVILYEVDLENGSATEALTLPVAGLAPTELNELKFANYLWNNLTVTPHGTDLLITFGVITPDRGRHHFRTVRVDTAQLP